MSTSRTERHEVREHRTRRASAAPFVGHWAIWFLVVPVAGSAVWWMGEDIRWRITDTVVIPLAPGRADAAKVAIGMAFLVALALALVSVGIGFKVTKRVPFVVVHVASSWLLAAVLMWLTGSLGWSWIWAVVHAGLSCIGAFSWNLYKVDALRSDKAGKDGDNTKDTFAKLIGLPGAVVGQPKIDAHHITAEIDPGLAKTQGDVEKALEQVEQAIPAALPGRSRIERVPGAKKFRMVFMHTDPLTPWPVWTGPSHPGGSFADGAVAGRYADGQPEVIHFAKHRNPLSSDGEDCPASGVVSVGMTRAGKSGHGAVIWTDAVFTRRDAGMVYLDGAKPGQSLAGQIMQDLTLYASTTAQGSIAPMKTLLTALHGLVKYRSEVMGAAGHRDWTARTYEQLGLAALLVVIDEGDLIAGTKAFRDLVTKCLSVGIYVHLLLPRMDGDSLDTTARTALGPTLCFGTGDDYSHGFALVKQTIARGGGKVCDWRNTKPGYHLYDAVPGVDEDRWAMDVRSLKAEFEQLIPHIVAGRRYRANGGQVLTDGEIAVLGRYWEMFQPPRRQPPIHAQAGVYRPADPPPAPIPAPAAEAQEGQTVMTTETTEPYDMRDWSQADPDEDIPVPAMHPDDAEPGDLERYAAADRPGPPDADSDDPAEDVPWTAVDKPKAPSRQASYEAFDATIRAIASESEHTTNKEVIDRYPYSASDSWFSERMWAVSRGDVIVPGLTLTPLGRGEWHINREASATIDGHATVHAG